MLAKGEKTKYVREAIQTLGLQTSLKQVQAWISKKYGADAAEVGDSTFYNLRREMREATPARPSIETLVADAPAAPPTPPAKAEDNGIVALVKQLKLVVSKLGKNETKDLVDVL
jgi:hypothetical protein